MVVNSPSSRLRLFSNPLKGRLTAEGILPSATSSGSRTSARVRRRYGGRRARLTDKKNALIRAVGQRRQGRGEERTSSGAELMRFISSYSTMREFFHSDLV